MSGTQSLAGQSLSCLSPVNKLWLTMDHPSVKHPACGELNIWPSCLSPVDCSILFLQWAMSMCSLKVRRACPKPTDAHFTVDSRTTQRLRPLTLDVVENLPIMCDSTVGPSHPISKFNQLGMENSDFLSVVGNPWLGLWKHCFRSAVDWICSLNPANRKGELYLSKKKKNQYMNGPVHFKHICFKGQLSLSWCVC